MPMTMAEQREAFLEAAWEGDLDAVARLHEAGVPLDSLNHNGYSALQLAIENDNTEVVAHLLTVGADANDVSWSGWPAIAHAVELAWDAASQMEFREPIDTTVIEMLLDAGADPYLKSSKDGVSAMGFAEEFGSTVILEALTGRAEGHSDI